MSGPSEIGAALGLDAGPGIVNIEGYVSRYWQLSGILARNGDVDFKRAQIVRFNLDRRVRSLDANIGQRGIREPAHAKGEISGFALLVDEPDGVAIADCA